MTHDEWRAALIGHTGHLEYARRYYAAVWHRRRKCSRQDYYLQQWLVSARFYRDLYRKGESK